MPTIPQLPMANSVSVADELPISQSGTTRSVTVGTLLAATQPAIAVASPALIGRTSLGPGGPEPITVGLGLNLAAGTLAATGLDHGNFPIAASLPATTDLVISNQGTPMLMDAELLRGLFSAGQNVTISASGTISASTAIESAGYTSTTLPVTTSLFAQDLVTINQAGTAFAITCGNFLGGVTIDQGQLASQVSETDTLWVAQGGDVMAVQNFSAIWTWVAGQMPSYKSPVVEIISNTNLDTTVHNGRILVCSQPVTLTPLTTNMGNGFHCTVINASSGNVTFGIGCLSSNGSSTLNPLQSAEVYCATYSGGTIAFAAIAGATSSTVSAVPGQVSGVSATGITATAMTISWQAPQAGAAAASYTVQYRQSETASWQASPAITSGTTCQLSGLQAATSYDITVVASDASGTGPTSAILTVFTAGSAMPAQVTGLTASATSASAIQLSWSAQTGSTAATSFDVYYRVTGASAWTSLISGISATNTPATGLQSATSYDFVVTGVNTAGSGPASSVTTCVTEAASQPSVTSITWNLLPAGPYTHGSGAIGVNAHVSPGTSAIQFGFSTSTTSSPASWTSAILVNSDLWGAYVPTPSTAGNWYVWAEGIDGSAPTVYPTSFVVQ